MTWLARTKHSCPERLGMSSRSGGWTGTNYPPRPARSPKRPPTYSPCGRSSLQIRDVAQAVSNGESPLLTAAGCSGLPEQFVKLPVDVNEVALGAGRDDAVSAAEEFGSGAQRRFEMRLTER